MPSQPWWLTIGVNIEEITEKDWLSSQAWFSIYLCISDLQPLPNCMAHALLGLKK